MADATTDALDEALRKLREPREPTAMEAALEPDVALDDREERRVPSGEVRLSLAVPFEGGPLVIPDDAFVDAAPVAEEQPTEAVPVGGEPTDEGPDLVTVGVGADPNGGHGLSYPVPEVPEAIAPDVDEPLVDPPRPLVRLPPDRNSTAEAFGVGEVAVRIEFVPHSGRLVAGLVYHGKSGGTPQWTPYLRDVADDAARSVLGLDAESHEDNDDRRYRWYRLPPAVTGWARIGGDDG